MCGCVFGRPLSCRNIHLAQFFTNFGAFVDIGVHQDGLIHISKLSHSFVKNPHELISVGDALKVTVLEIDIKRKRIQLSAIGPS